MTDMPDHDDAPAPAEPEEDIGQRPPAIPEKFWDAEHGTLRSEALLQSYRELERRLSAEREPATASAVPDGLDAYAIEVPHGLFENDPALNARLHAAGFSNQQAQLVYDLAAERMLPMVEALATAYGEQDELDRLRAHFGGPEKWAAASRQLAAWGRAHLPEDAYAALACSYDGVLTLHRLMTGGDGQSREPTLLRGGADGEAMSAERLRRMVRDPRYWRDRDPAFMRQVSDGFRRLYPVET